MGTVHKQQSTTVAEGKVIKTDPASGATVRSKSSVDIYVSSGNENIIKMKDFVGEKLMMQWPLCLKIMVLMKVK